MRRGTFWFLPEQDIEAHQGHEIVQRSYLALDPPAVFVDCWDCLVTWEIGKRPGEEARPA